MVSSNGNVLDGVAIKHGILLSPLLLVLTLIPLTMLLKGENIGYKLGKYQELINYLMFVRGVPQEGECSAVVPKEEGWLEGVDHYCMKEEEIGQSVWLCQGER